jgi:hypothetical protein
MQKKFVDFIAGMMYYGLKNIFQPINGVNDIFFANG